jgi:hypothetical protein
VKKIIQTSILFLSTQLFFGILQAQNKTCYVWVNGHWERPRANKEYHPDSLYCITPGQSLPNEPKVTVTDRLGDERNQANNGNMTVVDHRIGRDMTSPFLKAPPNIEEMTVYRIQLVITTTDNVTNNPVWIMFGESELKFYLYKPVNFRPRTRHEFEILNPNIKRLKDLKSLRIGIDGSDGMCFKSIQLMINNCNSPLFTLDSISANQTCFDNDNYSYKSFFLTYFQLRNNPNWNLLGARENMWRPCTKITKDWMTSLIEAAVGSNLARPYPAIDFKWGSRDNKSNENTLFGQLVDIEYLNNNTLKVDLDLDTGPGGLGPKYEVDIKFELKFHCDNGRITIETQNIKVSTKLPMVNIDLVKRKGVELIDAAIGTDVFTPNSTIKLRSALAFYIPVNNYNCEHQNCPSSSCTKTIVTKTEDILLR